VKFLFWFKFTLYGELKEAFGEEGDGRGVRELTASSCREVFFFFKKKIT
jgi:hypothetical protein